MNIYISVHITLPTLSHNAIRTSVQFRYIDVHKQLGLIQSVSKQQHTYIEVAMTMENVWLMFGRCKQYSVPEQHD